MARPAISRAVLAVAGLALALAACGGDDGNVDARSTGSSTPSVGATVASSAAPASAVASATTASSLPNMCDLVTKAQLEAIAEKPNTTFEKGVGGLEPLCRFRHDYPVEGENLPYAGFNGSATITRPSSPDIQTKSMKSFREQYADGRPYPCDVGDDCAVIQKNNSTEGRMLVGVYHVRLNGIVVRKPGASSDENIRLAQERAVKLLQLIASGLATR